MAHLKHSTQVRAEDGIGKLRIVEETISKY
jgi:hypothetical protein